MKKYLLQIIIIITLFSFNSCKKYEERGKTNVTISGYIIDKCSGQPIENIGVSLFKSGHGFLIDDSIASVSAKSDMNGYYEIAFRAKEAYSNTNYNTDYDLRFTGTDYFLHILPLCILDPSIDVNDHVAYDNDSTKTIVQYDSKTEANVVLSKNTLLMLTFQGILNGTVCLEDYRLEFATYNAYYFPYSWYRNSTESILSDTTFTFTVKACDSVRVYYEVSNPITFDSTVYIYCPLDSIIKDTISL